MKYAVIIVLQVIIGIVVAINDKVPQNNKDNYIINSKDDCGVSEDYCVSGKEMIQRRGSWRYAADHLLFDSDLRKQIERESSIVVR